MHNSSTHRQRLNVIDKVLGECMVHSEKKCRKIRAGTVPFSPILSGAGLLIQLLGPIARHHSGANVNTRRIRRMAAKCNVPKALSCSLEVAQQKKVVDQKYYHKLKQWAHSLRVAFLRKILDNTQCHKAQREIRAIIQHEDI